MVLDSYRFSWVSASMSILRLPRPLHIPRRPRTCRRNPKASPVRARRKRSTPQALTRRWPESRQNIVSSLFTPEVRLRVEPLSHGPRPARSWWRNLKSSSEKPSNLSCQCTLAPPILTVCRAVSDQALVRLRTEGSSVCFLERRNRHIARVSGCSLHRSSGFPCKGNDGLYNSASTRGNLKCPPSISSPK